MIGIGKWKGKIDTLFYKGEVSFKIVDDGGTYRFEPDIPEDVSGVPSYSIGPIREDGDTLSAQAEVSLLPGKKIDVSMTFDGDRMNGTVKIPFLGKVKLRDFQKIQSEDRS